MKISAIASYPSPIEARNLDGMIPRLVSYEPSLHLFGPCNPTPPALQSHWPQTIGFISKWFMQLNFCYQHP
jgi:hypothetical protein